MCKKLKIVLGVAIIGLFCLYIIYSLPTFETLIFGFIITAFPLLVCYSFTSYKKRNRIGDLAIEKNMLTEEEVVNIILCQKLCTHRFGEVAIREKYLSDMEVARLLSEQNALLA